MFFLISCDCIFCDNVASAGRPRWLKRDPIVNYVVLNTNLEFRLTCRASGKPKPSVVWLKNGEPFTKRFNNESVWYFLCYIERISGAFCATGGAPSQAVAVHATRRHMWWVCCSFVTSWVRCPQNQWTRHTVTCDEFTATVRQTGVQFIGWKCSFKRKSLYSSTL